MTRTLFWFFLALIGATFLLSTLARFISGEGFILLIIGLVIAVNIIDMGKRSA